jgi:magnesium transporter
LHAADQADLVQLLNEGQREGLARALGPALHPETLSYLDEEVRRSLIELLGPDITGSLVAQLDTDDAIGALSDLEPAQQASILATLPIVDRAAIEQGLAFPESSAGRLMQREVVAVPDYWTVSQAIDFVRGKSDLPDEFYEVVIVDVRYRPVGAVPVSQVLRSAPGTPLRQLQIKELRLVPAEMDQEQVAFLFRQYGLISAPVVDGSGRLLGVITVDDVVEVIQEEAEEDILRLGGVRETDVFARPLSAGFRRMPWLVVNLGTALLGASVIAHFEDAIARAVSLAVLMPMVASLGGNAGTQAMTVAVRALATRELTGANAWRTVTKELAIGALNGTTFLLLGALLVGGWFGDVQLALVFGTALAINLLVANLAGVLIPLLVSRLGLDPAVSSGVFLTAVTDCTGFFLFLGLAVWLLL